MEPLEQKLTEITAELVTFKGKVQEDIKLNGSVNTETKAAVDAIKTRIDTLQTQLDSLDASSQRINSPVNGLTTKSLFESLIESPEFKAAKERNFSGKMPMPSLSLGTSAFAGERERKSLITAAGIGTQTTGVIPLMRLPGLTILAEQGLRIRDLMPVIEMTTGNAYDWVRQTSRLSSPSPQVEGTTKAESTYTWDAQVDAVKTIAHFVNLSKQSLSDVPWLQAMINQELIYGLKLKEEAELLFGDGTGAHLKGVATQATAYAGTYDVSGDTKLDKLRHAKLEARVAGLATFAPDAFVLNPVDLQKIELIKTEEGGANKGMYVVGDPKTGTQITYVWNLPVVESDSMPAGHFLTGAFRTGAALVDRMQAMIEVSFENNDNFVKNIATVLCEERVGLAVRRPQAFIYGTI